MKQSIWAQTFFFCLVLSICSRGNGLDLDSCQRLREICRDGNCEPEVLYRECGKFMTSKNIAEEDALPPMSLVKAWLFFPEVLNPYHGPKEHHHTNGHHHPQNEAIPPMSLAEQWTLFPGRALGPLEQEKHRSHKHSRGKDGDVSEESSFHDARNNFNHNNDGDDHNEEIIQRVRRLLADYKKIRDDSDDEEDNEEEGEDDGEEERYPSRDHSRSGAGHHRHSKKTVDGLNTHHDEPIERNLDVKVIKAKGDGEDYEMYRLHNGDHLRYVLGVVERASKMIKRAKDGRDRRTADSRHREQMTSQSDVSQKSLIRDINFLKKASKKLKEIEENGSPTQPDNEHLQSSDLKERKNNARPVINGEPLHTEDVVKPNNKHLGSAKDHKAADLQVESQTEKETSQESKTPALVSTHEKKKDSKVETHNDAKKHFFPSVLKDDRDLEQNLSADQKKTLILQFSERVKPESLKTVGGKVQKVLWGIDSKQQRIFTKASLGKNNKNKVYLRMQVPHNGYSTAFNPTVVANKINTDESLRNKISKATGLNLVHAKSTNGDTLKLPRDKNWDEFAIITAIVGGCTLGLIVASVLICSLKRRYSGKLPIELQKKEALTDYEELCRTQMAVNDASPRTVKAINADRQRHGLVDGQGKYTKKTWREEPLAYNMDISTGHVILAYMEEHLKNEDKLSQEWEALCNYKADRDETTTGEDSKNSGKNRYSNVLPYDHTRVKLRETSNVYHSDYINASFITDTDPRNPAYIATQGPLDNTVADFWQMIWEQGVVVIVNLTRLSDMGLPQCHRYWPEEGSQGYNTYQVHLISEHIWCDDYIVRSFYLKHLATQETRTITQFHFLTWPDLSIPESAKPLLEFRRKVNKCYRGQACPIVVHCNNGVGRTGTYILIDMVLKKMIKGTKEIDIAATLEHLRDQRPDMVKTKAQFEFCLAAVAEEVTAILSSLSN